MKKKNLDALIGFGLIAVIVLGFIIYREATVFRPAYKNITDEQIVEKMAAGEEFTFFVGTETCQYCIIYKPIISEYASKTNTTIYYLDLQKNFSSTQEQKDFFKNVLQTTESTPQTFYVKGGKIVESFQGSADYYALVRFFERNQTPTAVVN